MTGCQSTADHCEQIETHHIEINPKRSTGADMNSAVTRIILEEEIAPRATATESSPTQCLQRLLLRRALLARSGHAVAQKVFQKWLLVSESIALPEQGLRFHNGAVLRKRMEGIDEYAIASHFGPDQTERSGEQAVDRRQTN